MKLLLGSSQKRTILVLEDERWLREIYVLALRRQGFDVYAAPNAQEALDLLDEHAEIDLVVVDLLLPGANGLAFLYEAVSHLDWQDKNYVLLSSILPNEIQLGAELFKHLNIVDYLYKPAMSPIDLAARIEQVLEPISA